MLVGMSAFALCMGTVAVVSDPLVPVGTPPSALSAPKTVEVSQLPVGSTVLVSSTQTLPSTDALPLVNRDTDTSALEASDEAADEAPMPEPDVQAIHAQLQKQERLEAERQAELVAQAELDKEAEALAAIEQQRTLAKAQDEALREREARLKAEAELKSMREAYRRLSEEPRLPPPVPKEQPVPKPVRPAAAKPSVAPAPESSPVADLNSTRALWEYLPPVETVRSQDATEAWREVQGTTPLQIDSAGKSSSAGQQWVPGQSPASAARIQLIQGDVVWVSIDRKKTEQVRVGGRHPTLGLLKSINGYSVTFEQASLNYNP